jgi:hypothetical protein
VRLSVSFRLPVGLGFDEPTFALALVFILYEILDV